MPVITLFTTSPTPATDLLMNASSATFDDPSAPMVLAVSPLLLIVLAVPVPTVLNNLRIPRTDHAVVNNVNTNPPTSTDTTLTNSVVVLPKLVADNGKVIKLGIKNTGNHDANRLAPGFNT